MINDVKTEFLIIGTCHQLEKTSIDSIIVGDTIIRPLESAQNLGPRFDAHNHHMWMNVHVGKICSKALCGLYNITQIRKFLSVQLTKTLIHAFVSLHLDYCNALLFGLSKYQLDRLQNVQNATARVILQIINHTCSCRPTLAPSNIQSSVQIAPYCLQVVTRPETTLHLFH